MKWNKISEIPPPKNIWINILENDWKSWGTGLYHSRGWVFKDNYGSWMPPTHWMPLSELPKYNQT
jgi:hypothetical protein